MKMNLPNRLTVLRLFLVPIVMLIGFLPSSIIPFYLSCFLCAALFIGTAVTDMLDGKIARKRGLITSFGKFLDPIADKFMVIGAMFVVLYKFSNLKELMIASLIIVIFREFAVTSIRLVVSTGEGVVVAANVLGKVKTVSQIVFVSTALLEPVVQFVAKWAVELITGKYPVWPENFVILTWLTMLFMLVMTVWSGVNYIKSYWKFIDAEK